MSAKKAYCYPDTTVAYFLLGGHSLQRIRTRALQGARPWRISPIVRMEYLRGVIVTLIEFHALLKQSDTVGDAFAEWSSQFNQRRIRVVMTHISKFLAAQASSDDRTIVARRLRDYIQDLLEDFDELFAKVAPNHLACQLAALRFSATATGDDVLLDFSERFFAIFDGIPQCNQCSFRRYWADRLHKKGVDLHSDQQQANFPGRQNAGYRKQASHVAAALHVQGQTPSCQWCVRLGDTMVALQCPAKDHLIAGDRSFAALSQILGKEFSYVPSIPAIKRGA